MEINVRERAARRWMADRLVRVEEEPGDDAVMQQLSGREIYEDYCRHVPKALQWAQWRLTQELPAWCKRYHRKAEGGRFPIVHYAGVRLKGGK